MRTNVNYTYGQFIKHTIVYTCTMTVVVRSPAYCVWLSYLIFSYIKCPERQDTVVSFSVYAQIVHPTEREPCDELY